MAKKLVHEYTFSPATNTVVIDYIYKPERLLLINNVTKGQTIYIFNDAGLGYSSISYDYPAEKTSIILQYNCSAMSSLDKLQIFVETDSAKFEPDDAFIDPVSKFRVSQPENLIDTDFEYGLQSTKWETLELVKNIPTFFSRSGDESFTVISLDTGAGSDVISVVTAEEHDLLTGSPIIVSGSKSTTCDGAFVVTNILSSTQFLYRSKAIQNFTGSVKDEYTQVFSGSVYQGTEFDLTGIDAITTDGAVSSKLTVNTKYPTIFTPGTSFFLTNSIAKVNLAFNAASVVSENYNTVIKTTTNNTATGESNGFAIGAVQPYDYTGQEVKYFTNADVTVDTVAETITFATAHGFADNTLWMYVIGEGNTAIGGLASYTGYYVRTLSTTQIYLTATLGGTTRINLTAVGSDGGVMRSAMIRAYKATAANTTTELVTFEQAPGLTNNSSVPLLFFSGTMSSMTTTASLLNPTSVYYSKTVSTATTIGFSLTPGGAIINLTSATANAFMIKASLLEEKDTVYFANHGLSTDAVVLFTVPTGTVPGGLTNDTYYKIEKVSTNRIRFKINDTGAVVNITSIGAATSTFQIETRSPNLFSDSINIPNNTLADGTEVIYDNMGNASVPGMVTGTTYYVFQKSQNYFKLATTITGWSTGAITVTSVNTTTNVLTTATNHGFTTGKAVQYLSGTPLGGLTNGGWFWVRVVTATTFTLHWSQSGAQGNQDIVDITTNLVGAHTVREANLVDIQLAGTGSHRLTATSAGASDGVYTLTENTSEKSFTVSANNQVVAREFDVTDVLDFTRSAFYYPNHGMATGTPVLYTTSVAAHDGMTASTTYYLIRVSRNWFKIASSSANAAIGQNITVFSIGEGTHKFTTSSVSGEVLGIGTVAVTANSEKIIGTSTNFPAIFSAGDAFRVYKNETVVEKVLAAIDIVTDIITVTAHGMADGSPIRFATIGSLPGGMSSTKLYFVRSTLLPDPANQITLHRSYLDAILNTGLVDITSIGAGTTGYHITDLGDSYQIYIEYVNSKSEIILKEAVAETLANATYAVGTGLYLRSDGSALHRPYDGGVELIPSRNPDSQMIRQTRKYFRYQSGKGIQVSFAVNFSPTTSLDTLEVYEDQTKVTKCRRDVEYFIDGVGYDLTLGTNYNAIFLGIAESNSLDISQKVIDTIIETKDEVLNVSAVSGDPTSITRVNSFFAEILTIIQNDRTFASPLYFTNPSTATASQTAAKDRLLDNLLFIEEEINAWVDITYPDHNHDVSKCARDVKYAVQAAAYDILYGGNSASYSSAKFFLYFYAAGTSGIEPEHITQTVAAYGRLKTIISAIVQGTLITPSAGNILTQDVTGDNASAGDAAILVSLIEIVQDTIDNAAVPVITKVYPDVTWSSLTLQASKTAIDSAKTTIAVTVVPASFAFLTAVGRTRSPHRMSVGSSITVTGASGNTASFWNGSQIVTAVPDQYSFRFSLDGVPEETTAQGIVEYCLNGWTNSRLKCGLFDDQNGLYFEYDGQELYCVRRSSVKQISGTVSVSFKSGEVIGTNTKFSSQLSVNGRIVIKGQTYVISKISSNTLLYILPSYRGEDSQNVVVTKTVDTKTPQSEWNIDRCDGTGPTGFYLNINRIQMAYMDYSWYGAGKVRFGFKDQTGLVTYVHEYIHNNKFTEAYMRSGNLPGRYEVENVGDPSYVPALAHWGTSIIMDGRYDDDKAYVFTANSNNISVTGTSSQTISARVESNSTYQVQTSGGGYRFAGYALSIATPNSTFSNIPAGIEVTGAGLQAGTRTALPNNNNIVPRQPYLPSISSYYGGNFNTLSARTLLMIDRQPTTIAATPTNYAIVLSTVATPVVYDIPLISIRLAPSVDNGSPGYLGQREIINRMQLILSSVGILSTHSAEITLKLNGQINNNSWQRVTNPSLSQLLYHTPTDTISGGTTVYSFRAQGGTGTTGRTAVITTADLGDIATLGNSIMGGDGVFPDGPDVLTVVAKLVEDPSTVTATNPFSVTGRISWAESQA